MVDLVDGWSKLGRLLSIVTDSRFLVTESTSDLRSCCSYVESLSRVVDGRKATGVAPRDFINSWDELQLQEVWGPVRTCEDLWGPGTCEDSKVYWLYCFVDAIRFRSIQHSARSASVGPFWTMCPYLSQQKWLSAFSSYAAEVDIGRFRQYRIRHPNSTAVDRNGPPGALKKFAIRNRLEKT